MSDQVWAPVAEQAVGTFERVPTLVQIALVLAGTVIILAMITVWYLTRRAAGEGTVPAALMVQVTTEFSHQVAHLAATVEGIGVVVGDLRDTIKGCSTCPFHPNAKKE